MLDTARNDIDLWLVDYRQIQDTRLLKQYAQLLNAEEAARHQRFIYSADQHQFLVARALVRSVLAKYLGQDNPASLSFDSTHDGKPTLSGDTSLQFNLSHTKGLLALAVSRQAPVGVDVENLSRQAQIEKLARRYFARDEMVGLLALPEDTRRQRFFDLWTLKEAYLKACGTGLRTPLSAFSFSFKAEQLAVRFSSALQDDPKHWKFWQLDLAQTFRLSLALHDTLGRNYQLRVYTGVPLTGFTEVQPIIHRSNFT